MIIDCAYASQPTNTASQKISSNALCTCVVCMHVKRVSMSVVYMKIAMYMRVV